MMDLFYTIDKDGSGELVRVQQLVLSLPIAAFPRCADCVVFPCQALSVFRCASTVPHCVFSAFRSLTILLSRSQLDPATIDNGAPSIRAVGLSC